MKWNAFLKAPTRWTHNLKMLSKTPKTINLHETNERRVLNHSYLVICEIEEFWPKQLIRSITIYLFVIFNALILNLINHIQDLLACVSKTQTIGILVQQKLRTRTLILNVTWTWVLNMMKLLVATDYFIWAEEQWFHYRSVNILLSPSSFDCLLHRETVLVHILELESEKQPQK